MAAGHSHDGAGGQSSQVIDRLLSNPEFVVAYHREYRVDNSHDLPYLGGTSNDAQTIYLDRHLPETLKYEVDGHVTEFRPATFIECHERFERAAMDVMGWGYLHAHAAATGYERRRVVSAGLHWPQYNKVVNKYVKSAEHEKLVKVPSDIDMRPYMVQPVDRKLIAHMEEAMGLAEDKESKSAVDYESVGMAKSHCGPTKNWPSTGECKYYLDHSCEKVKGYISPRGWCKRWKHGED